MKSLRIDPTSKQRIAMMVEATAKEYVEWLLQSGEKFTNGCIMPTSETVRWQGLTTKTHRFIYAVVNGYIPPHTIIMHSCDNNPCINPEHLEAGTSSKNAQDAKLRGKSQFGAAYRAMRSGR